MLLWRKESGSLIPGLGLSGGLEGAGLPPGEMDSTVTSTEVTILSAVLWRLTGTALVSALLGSKGVPMVSGSLQVSLEGLLQVWVSVQVALRLVVGDWSRAPWVSSLEEAPSDPVRLGSLNGGLVLASHDVAVSIQVALSHLIVHVWHAMLVSLFFVTELSPVSLRSLYHVFTLKSSLEVWVPIKIALTFFVINMFLIHEVISLLPHIFTQVCVIFSLLLAPLAKAWALRVVVWVPKSRSRRDNWLWLSRIGSSGGGSLNFIDEL